MLRRAAFWAGAAGTAAPTSAKPAPAWSRPRRLIRFFIAVSRDKSCRRSSGKRRVRWDLFPGVEQLLDPADVDVFGQLDAVHAGERRFGRSGADAVTAQIVVQIVGATARHADEVSFAFNLHAQDVLLSLGHGSS